jgi:hypothetical protein
MTTNENAKRSGTATTTKPSNERAATPAATSKPSGPSLKNPQAAGPDEITATRGAAALSPKREPAVAKTKLTYEERMRRLTPIVQVRRKVDSTIKRFTNLADEVRRWKNAPGLHEATSKVEVALAGMLAEATTTPDTFEPERVRKAAASHLTPGTAVALRDKFVARYDGVLDPAERASLEVVAIARGHVSVKTATGARIVLPRGHVTRTDVA